MQQGITYDASVATALFEWAFPEWETAPYLVREGGIYQSEQYRTVSPPGETFDWTPAYDMDWVGAPNPMTAPILPTPFTAAELAAAMLDGAGAMIPQALECPLGDSVEQSLRLPIDARLRDVRAALQGAYAQAALAVKRAGDFDHAEMAAAHAMLEKYSEANGQANAHEGVFAVNISPEESRARRARAVASVAELKAQAEQAKREAYSKWKSWRGAMVRVLLCPEVDRTLDVREVRKGTTPVLTADQKSEIARLYATRENKNISALARKFQVSRRTIDEVLLNGGLKAGKPRKARSGSAKTPRKTA